MIKRCSTAPLRCCATCPIPLLTGCRRRRPPGASTPSSWCCKVCGQSCAPGHAVASCALLLLDAISAAEHLLAAFSLSEKGEDREYQQQRLDACQACWDSLASHMEVSNAFAGRSSQTVVPLPLAMPKAPNILQSSPQKCTHNQRSVGWGA